MSKSLSMRSIDRLYFPTQKLHGTFPREQWKPYPSSQCLRRAGVRIPADSQRGRRIIGFGCSKLKSCIAKQCKCVFKFKQKFLRPRLKLTRGKLSDIIGDALVVLCMQGLLRAKRFVSVNTVLTEKVTMTQLQDRWNIISKGILKIRNSVEGVSEHGLTSQEYSTLYTTIYDMCLPDRYEYDYHYPKELYHKYQESFEQYMKSTVLPELKEKHGELLLKEFVRRWENHKVMVQRISNVFSYLDRSSTLCRNRPLKEVGLLCFRDLVYNKLKENVKNAVTTLIDRGRDGEAIEQALLRKVFDVCMEIERSYGVQYYMRGFDEVMLEHTEAYYSRKAASWILQDSFPDYMVRVEDCLKYEEDIVAHYLSSNRHQDLVEIVQNQLLFHYKTQLKSHYPALFRDDKLDCMSTVYRLLVRIRGVESLANIFEEHLIREGTTLLKEVEDYLSNKSQRSDIGGMQGEEFVHKFIELHHKYMKYVEDPFQNNSLFYIALKKAFEVLCSKEVIIVELLATVCHDALKKVGSEIFYDHHDIDNSLEKVMKVLVYVRDKDLFANLYKKDLASRLLLPKSTNLDHERSMLSKMEQCGYQFTSKMQRMVTDWKLAQENQTSFKEYLKNNPSIIPEIDLTVTVLNTALWPTYKCLEFNLPVEMVKCLDAFKEFYSSKRNQHKLTWIYSLGNCTLHGNFDTRALEMTVSTYQAALLLLFNASEKLSYSDIASKLNLTDEVVVGLLDSLACGKYKILLKEPSRDTIAITHNFEFNPNFTNRVRSIHIPLPTVYEKKKIINDVETDRRCAIDALLVRTMKRRKVLTSQQIVSECLAQFPMFKSDLKPIKNQIEDLITRDYIQRDKGNSNILRYLN